MSQLRSAWDSGKITTTPPDTPYALVVGLYLAVLIAPAVVLAIRQVVADAAILYISFLTAVTGVTILVGMIVSRTTGLVRILGRHDAVWLLAVLPFGWFGGAFGAIAVGYQPPNLVFPLAVVGTAGGMLLGIVLVAMSRTRYADAVFEETTELTEWDARWPHRWRRVGGAIAIGAFALSTIGILAAFIFDSEWGWRLYYLLFVGVLSMNLLNERTFRLTDAGIIVEHPLQRLFRPWSAFESYELTDDALIIRSRTWWLPAHRCDRSEIDDVETILETLEVYLSVDRPVPRSD